MKTRGAIIRQTPGTYEVVDLVVDEPRRNEVRVRMVAAGLCHSDDHTATGDLPVVYPVCGGHEGAGVIESVGPDTPGFEPGDKVIFSFVSVCGRCRWCSTGHQNLCDLGAGAAIGARWEDPESFRMAFDDGTPVAQFLGISTFAEYTTVSTNSIVKVPADTPLEKAFLLGCAAGTDGARPCTRAMSARGTPWSFSVLVASARWRCRVRRTSGQPGSSWWSQ